MKKRFILAITTILLVLNCFVVFAEETEDYQYEVRDGKAVLTSYLGTETVVEIPAEIEGYTVIGLEGTFKENQHIEKVAIPDGIEFLGTETFCRCRNLENVELPDSIAEMGWRCFSESAIKEIYIPNKLEELPLAVFSKCENLEKVDFSNSNLKSIEQFAFMGCTSLRSSEIPDTVVKIGEGIFYICNNIEIFTIPENIESISYSSWPVVSGTNLRQIVNLSNKEFDKAIYYYGTDFDHTWFNSETGYELAEYLPANSTIYRREKDSSKKYLDKYLQVLSKVNVSMKDINKEEKMLEFIISKKPEPDLSSIISEVEIVNFYAATEGNKYNIDGSKGHASVLIKVNNSTIENDTAQGYITININPIPYKEEEKPSEEESADSSEEETTNNNQETTDNEEETTENKPDETTDSSQEEETSSNNDKNVIKVYVEQVLQSIPKEISMKEVNTEEEASAYAKGFFDETLIDKYKLDISIESFRDAERGTRYYPSGRKGSFRIFVRAEGMGDYGYKLITINPIAYVEDENYILTKKYSEQYKEVLENLKKFGISMKTGNTPSELKKYIESLAPKNENENISFEVRIFEKDSPILFRKAVAGTKNNKNGTNGSCPLSITFKNSLCEEEIKISVVIPILATKYEGNSNSGSSSDRDDEEDDDEPYTSIVDNSYENKNTLSNLESLLVSNTATVFFGNVSQVKIVEKTENGICIISKNNEVIFNKKDGTLAKNEWQKSGDDWYYFDSDCKAAKGWKFLGNQWYYLNDTTKKMEIGWLKSPASGKWYYLDLKNGNMKTGWQQVSSRWYYMDSTGAMMVNTITPDGYRVNEKGEWVK